MMILTIIDFITICLNNKSNHIATPCGHICLCKECTKVDEYNTNKNKNIACATSRRNAQGTYHNIANWYNLVFCLCLGGNISVQN